MIPAAPPLVVAKNRTVVVGGAAFSRQSLTVDMTGQGLSDIRWMLRSIAARDTAEQIKLQNPPTVVTVDNRTTREFDEAKHRIDVLYGTKLASAAMRLVETALRAAIDKATVARSGRLHNVSGAWRWVLRTPGQAMRVVTAATELPVFVRGSILVLEPYSVPHATRVNSLVVGGGGLKSKRATRMRKGQMGPPKPKQSIGFLRAAVEAVKSRAEFRDFNIGTVFTKRYTVPGELSKLQGTGSIVIILKKTKFRF